MDNPITKEGMDSLITKKGMDNLITKEGVTVNPITLLQIHSTMDNRCLQIHQTIMTSPMDIDYHKWFDFHLPITCKIFVKEVIAIQYLRCFF